MADDAELLVAERELRVAVLVARDAAASASATSRWSCFDAPAAVALRLRDMPAQNWQSSA